MIQFILIAGIWVNTQAITTLEQNGKYCMVYVINNGDGRYLGNNQLRDPRPCEEIINEIQK